MLNIICLITVTVMAPLSDGVVIPWMVQVQTKGHIIQEDDDAYLVDFSKEATTKNYMGDYTERVVQKSMCMKLK